jgi:cysteinyl-tRNA synthetase
VAAKEFGARFQAALANDLDMPSAVRVVNDLDHSTDVPPGEKHALLASWDDVLGLDLEREARAGWEPTEEMRRLVAERDEARASKDYARSDGLRDELQALGLEVMDTAGGTRVRPQN